MTMTIANVDQAAAWDGDEGDHWTEHAEQYERGTDGHWQAFVDAGLVGGSDDVLDIGCGTGKSTRDLAHIASGGTVLGVDLSSRMLAYARERCEREGLTNVGFLQADAQVHPFEAAAFDVVFSSFGAMFFNDPVAAFANIGNAIRPGGRLALLVWRELQRNEWLTTIRAAIAVGRELPVPPPDAPTPFSLADPGRVERILTEAGFEAVSLDPVEEPVLLGDDVEDAYDFISNVGIVRGLTEELDDGRRAQAFDNLRAAVEAADSGHGVHLGTSAWLITATRP